MDEAFQEDTFQTDAFQIVTDTFDPALLAGGYQPPSTDEQIARL